MATRDAESDLIRGNIDAIVLSALSTGDSYGYEILKDVAHMSGGTYEMKEPSLYTSLKRLEGTGKDPDKFESAGPEFFQSVREAYHVRMAENPRIHAIDSSKTLPECVEDVAKILSDYLPTMKASAKQTPSRRF